MHESIKTAPAPHLHSEQSTRTVMLDVILALLPAALVAVWLFGLRALGLMLVSVASCVAYVIGEGLADAANADGEVIWMDEEEKPPEQEKEAEE